jgi:hypothetical protein
VEVAVSVIVIPLVMGLLAWLVLCLAASYYPAAWGLWRGATRRTWRRDALVVAILSIAAGAGLARLDALLANLFHAYAPIKDDLFPATFNTLSPALGTFLPSLVRSLVYAALAGLAIFVVRLGWKLRAWWLWLGLALVLVSLGPARAHSLAAFGVGWVMNFLPLLVAVAVVGFFFRDNILAYLMVLFCMQVAEPLVDLFAQKNIFFLQNGVALALLAGAVLVWMLWSSGGAEEAKG